MPCISRTFERIDELRRVAGERLQRREVERGAGRGVGADGDAEKTIVLTKLARVSAVDVESSPNSGPRTPAVPGTTVAARSS